MIRLRAVLSPSRLRRSFPKAPLLALLVAVGLAVFAVPASARDAYVASEGDAVTVFDANTGAAAGAPIFTGTKSEPFTLVITPNGKTVYTANYEVNSVSAIDTATKSVVATIPVGGEPIGITASPNGGRVYVANSEDDTVSVIDTATNQVVGSPIKVGDAPIGMAITPDGSRLFVANDNSENVSVIDTSTNQVVATMPVGLSPYGVAISPDGSRGYVANNDSDSLTVFDPHSSQPIGSPIPVGEDPSGIAITPNGSRAFVGNFGNDSMSIVDLGAGSVVNTVNGIENAEYPALTPDGKKGFISSDSNKGGVYPFDVQDFPTLGAPIAAEPSTSQIAVVPDQPPVASFGSPARIRPGVPGVLDAGASGDPDGSIANFAWTFGDGATAATNQAVTSHTYAQPGMYTVTLTLTDNEGCSTAFVSDGQTAYCNGSAVATKTLPIEIAYPGLRAKCPRSAKSRCKVALLAVMLKRKGGKRVAKPLSKIAQTKLKPGASRIVSIKAKPAFRGKLAAAKKLLVLEVRLIGKTATVRLHKLPVVR